MPNENTFSAFYMYSRTNKPINAGEKQAREAAFSTDEPLRKALKPLSPSP
jgi:hypothetical protein